MRKTHLYILSGVLTALLLTGFVARQSRDFSFEIAKNLEVFGSVLTEIDKVYVDDVEPNQFSKIGIDAMLKALDPYTNFYTASLIEDARIKKSGQSSSIGEVLAKWDDKIIIEKTYAEMPADEAGIRPGDELIAIDNETIEGEDYDISDVENLLRGQPNTTVKVKVRRPGLSSPLEFDVPRKSAEEASVPYFGFIEEGYGYIALNEFSRTASAEVSEALKALQDEDPEMQGLVLDLRGNPGGYLTEAVAICNLFVPPEIVVVEMRGKNPEYTQKFPTRAEPMAPDLPLTVLIDAKSASASEIVSGVMQDLDRGVVVGQRSFGKGLVQNTRPLSYKTQMKLTTARYYIPSGRNIQEIDYKLDKNKEEEEKKDKNAQAEFKTRNGRPVKSGSGVYPDVETPGDSLHPVTRDLKEQHFIHRYATRFSQQRERIENVEAFRISDEVYDDFVKFVRENDFEHTSDFSEGLESLDEYLEEEAYYDNVKSQIEALKEKSDKLAAEDVYAHKEEIKRLLRTEIASRYYYEEGRLLSSFEDDPALDAAIQTLKNESEYAAILAGKKK